MKSVYTWIARHSGLCRAVLFFGLIGFTVFAAGFEYVSLPALYLIGLVIWFTVGQFLSSAPAKLTQEPTEQLQQHCDPYPLLEELERQCGWNLNGWQGQLVRIDYATALQNCGEYRKAGQILENINIDKFPGTTLAFKYIYYHNLANVLYRLDRREEGRIWYKKSLQIYGDIPNGKVRQPLVFPHDMMEAKFLHYEGNHAEALQKVAWLKCPHMHSLLCAAMLAAKCHIALEEPEKAREKLQYVIDKGNKLHMVEEAKELLETLN